MCVYIHIYTHTCSRLYYCVYLALFIIVTFIASCFYEPDYICWYVLFVTYVKYLLLCLFVLLFSSGGNHPEGFALGRVQSAELQGRGTVRVWLRAPTADVFEYDCTMVTPMGL